MAEILSLRLTKSRRSAALAAHARNLEPAIAAALKADRTRVVELLRVSSQASRLGVAFDASAAIQKGISVDDARAAILAVASKPRKRRRKGRVDAVEALPDDYVALPAPHGPLPW